MLFHTLATGEATSDLAPSLFTATLARSISSEKRPKEAFAIATDPQESSPLEIIGRNSA